MAPWPPHLAAVLPEGCSDIITLLELQDGQVKQMIQRIVSCSSTLGRIVERQVFQLLALLLCSAFVLSSVANICVIIFGYH